MKIKTKLGVFLAKEVARREDNSEVVYEIPSIPYAKAALFCPPTLINSYEEGKIINSLETFCFPQRKVPIWINIFLKHHLMRKEWLPSKDKFSEDAFRICVWTSELDKKKPVLVYIHGGGDTGSGTAPIYSGVKLAKKGLVVVTITYRLGLYGYLPIIEDDIINCNRAAKDQKAALYWIKKNIVYLGGDPNNITLMGQSGGALSSLNQLLNQGEENLIHRAILCGGSFMHAHHITEGRAVYNDFLKRNKLTGFKELSSLTSKQVLRLKVHNAMMEVIDHDFFAESPRTALENGHYQAIPILVGFNDDEFSMLEFSMYYKAMGIARKKDKFQEAIFKKYGKYAKLLADELCYKAKDIVDLQIQMMELSIFYSMNLYFMEEFSKRCPVYGYKFNYVPNIYKGKRGSYHGAEVAMFFDNLDKMNIKITEKNKEEIRILQKDWLDFIRTGKITDKASYNLNKKIILYDHPSAEIDFPHRDLIEKLAGKGIFEKSMVDFLQGR